MYASGTAVPATLSVFKNSLILISSASVKLTSRAPRCEGELRYCATLLVGEGAQLLDEEAIELSVITLEARQGQGPHIALGECLALAEAAGDETTAQGHGGDNGNAELAACRQKVGAFSAFNVAASDGIVHLHGGNGRYLYGATERVGRNGGESYVTDLALTIYFVRWTAARWVG
jgi:hypothetical protein